MFRFATRLFYLLTAVVITVTSLAFADPPDIANMQHASITVADGSTIAYHTRPGVGPTLILIPGSWGDYHVYDELIRHLSPTHNIVIVEMRGHGGSNPPTMHGSIELFADDVLSVVKHLNPEHFYVGGHSIGGMIAIEIAGRAPSGLQGVISMEGWTHYEAQRDAFGGSDAPTLSPEQAQAREAMHARVKDKLTPEQRDAFGRIWRTWDGSAILAATSLPILELWGDRGRPKPSLSALRIPYRSNIQVAWIENASHSYLIEKPAEVGAAIERFLRDVSTSTGATANDK